MLLVPQPGEEVEFLPDRELQPVHYGRPRIVDLAERFVHRSPLAAAEAEAAEALQCWTVACLCRSLSIDNILTFLTGALRCVVINWLAVKLTVSINIIPIFLTGALRCAMTILPSNAGMWIPLRHKLHPSSH